MLQIRIATLSDRKGVDQLTEEFDDHEYSHAPSYFDEAISIEKILVAIESKQIVGYLTYHIIWGNTQYIELLRVSSSYQKKGIGSQLIQTLEKKLKSMGYKAILSSSEKNNSIGNTFHRKLGFHRIGELNMVYGKEIYFKKGLL